jgi:hypothetical protein
MTAFAFLRGKSSGGSLSEQPIPPMSLSARAGGIASADCSRASLDTGLAQADHSLLQLDISAVPPGPATLIWLPE